MTWWKSFEASLVIHTALALTSSHISYFKIISTSWRMRKSTRAFGGWRRPFTRPGPFFAAWFGSFGASAAGASILPYEGMFREAWKGWGKCRYLSMPPISWVVRSCRSSGTAPNSAASESRKKSATFARARASRRDAHSVGSFRVFHSVCFATFAAALCVLQEVEAPRARRTVTLFHELLAMLPN